MKYIDFTVLNKELYVKGIKSINKGYLNLKRLY